ncbi:MAG TPA: DinB family protein [Dehalococcoidia bacterium]|nr:DinB family protein [Dehalococcoidia bacterium]
MNFTDFAWADIETTLKSDNDSLQREAAGSGWPAMRNCLAHILRGRERWNDAIIDGKTGGMPDLAEGTMMTWDELNAYRHETGSRLTDFLEALDDTALHEKAEVDIDGTPLLYSPMDLALHLVLHEISHHGDVSTLMYQLGIEPWVPYYRFYTNPASYT